MGAVRLDYSMHFLRAVLASRLLCTSWRVVLAGEVGVSASCGVSVGKGGWFLCVLQGFIMQGRKLDGYISKARNSEKLDEARFLGKMSKCEISETYVNIDRT